jgi:hypothetical protein
MKKLRLLCAALAWPCTAAADAPFKESMDGGPEGVWISAGKAKRGNSIVTTRSPSFPPINRQQTSSINIRNFIGTESRRTPDRYRLSQCDLERTPVDCRPLQ